MVRSPVEVPVPVSLSLISYRYHLSGWEKIEYDENVVIVPELYPQHKGMAPDTDPASAMVKVFLA